MQNWLFLTIMQSIVKNCAKLQKHQLPPHFAVHVAQCVALMLFFTLCLSKIVHDGQHRWCWSLIKWFLKLFMYQATLQWTLFFISGKKIAKRNFCLDSFWGRSKNNFVLFSHVLIFVLLTQSKNSTTVFEVFKFLGLRNHWQKIDYFWPLCNV